MASHSLVFKSTVFPEWFQERIQPWVHYVPCHLDLSDLYDSLTFFRGDLNGDGAHAELGAQIALAGRDWAKAFWRDEDMTAYMFR
jgi:pyrroloquinoline quinone (PQQ) biosynthesis protein C